MKTMTCRQLGGPCDHPHSGASADEVIKLQDQHLKASVDPGHADAKQAMAGRWKNPVKGMGWYRRAKKDFAALPEV